MTNRDGLPSSENCPYPSVVDIILVLNKSASLCIKNVSNFFLRFSISLRYSDHYFFSSLILFHMFLFSSLYLMLPLYAHFCLFSISYNVSSANHFSFSEISAFDLAAVTSVYTSVSLEQVAYAFQLSMWCYRCLHAYFPEQMVHTIGSISFNHAFFFFLNFFKN